jgi:hypothetical protein
VLVGFAYLQMQALLAFNAAHPPINEAPCDTLEQGGYDIHAHLTIYVNGRYVTIPKGIGIAPDGSCFYWLLTHTSDGIIHIEARHARLSSVAHSTDRLEDLRQWQALQRSGDLAAVYRGAARLT